MKRREFIAGLGGAVAMPLAARAQEKRAARRRADERRGRRSGSAQSVGGISAGIAGAGLDRRPQLADRPTLGLGRGRSLSPSRRGIGRAWRQTSCLSPEPACWPCGRSIRTVPMVFPQAVDPVGAGFVASLSRPGGNATGFMQFEFSLAGKWLQLLREAAPGVNRVGLLREASQPRRHRAVGGAPGRRRTNRVGIEPARRFATRERSSAVSPRSRASRTAA